MVNKIYLALLKATVVVVVDVVVVDIVVDVVVDVVFVVVGNCVPVSLCAVAYADDIQLFI